MSYLNLLPTRVIGEIGRLLAAAEALKRNINVCKPEQDGGYDMVSVHGSRMCRIQVKTTTYRQKKGNTENFSVRRRRYSKKGDSLTARQYADAEIDVFVFVSLVSGKFWVIPSSDINLNSHFKCVRSGDKYENAWHHVMETA